MYVCVCVCARVCVRACVHVKVLGAAVGFEDFQVGVLMKWIELRNKELMESQ